MATYVVSVWSNNQPSGTIQYAVYSSYLSRNFTLDVRTSYVISEKSRTNTKGFDIEAGSMYLLTHWGRVTHICVGNLTIIGSDNGLSPGRRQAIIWTNAGLLLIWPLGTTFSEILIEIRTFSFNEMHEKLSSGKWLPFCRGLYVLSA